MDARKIKITVQVDGRGKLIYVDINGRQFTKPTHNLYQEERLPLGVLKGAIDIGQIHYYEGSLRICFKRPNGDLY